LENLAEGKNKYFNVALYPLIANGISGLVVRIDDITELEKKDEQLRQSQKMETVGTLAGGLAHDFNNVLGGIVGTISIIKFKLNKGLEIPAKTLKDYVETIERAGQRAADMVQQLLTLSRKQELSFAPVDLNLTIKHVFKICSNTIDKSVELKPCYTKEPAMVNADPGQMEQVLLNLSVNAGHAMTIMKKPGEHQGGTLTLSLKSLQADKYFCSSHPEAQEISYWVLSVQDTGTGMDSKTVAKIFDPFFTTKEKGKGTGLGLAMVYNIVQQHKGFIDVYSEIGIGTTFSVYLPSIETVQCGGECIEESKLAQGEGVILVVDDEAIMRELSQEILAECGYQVLLAENGEEGVDVFRKEHDRIDMVLLDMVMPKKSGKEAFIEMKKIDPNVKVLLASGFRKDDRVEEIIKLGLTGFIQKPYTIENLAQAVSEAMNEPANRSV
jgi:signal transduction histidine kinase/ActR/RegA family two-component response regulator